MYNKILFNQLIQNGGDNVLEQLNSQSIKSNGLNNNISSFGRSESNFKPKSTIHSYKEIRKLPLLKVRTTKEDKVDLLEAVLQLVNNLYRIS